ncbi:hypothetical protein [Alishewanella sp. HL-SH05]|uniref:hypothetical protein n=1 Tax=Alishewanella sp. HL-SH05 TaxID=3461145 RepID=UPI0040417E8A
MGFLKLLFLLCFFSCSVSASLILNVDSKTGKLQGAENVLVAGMLYNVKFTAGSFYNIFGNKENLDANSVLSFQFSQALIEQVLINSSFGNFASKPSLIEGCTNINNCAILTPYDLDYRGASPEWYVDGFTASVSNTQPSFVGSNIRNPNISSQFNWVYADWQSVSVSEPHSFILFLFGITFIIYRRILFLKRKV